MTESLSDAQVLSDAEAALRAAYSCLSEPARAAAEQIITLANDDHLRNQAMEAASEGITIADLRLPDAPLIYVNAGFEKVTGYSRAESVGRNCRFLQGPDTNPETIARLRATLQAGATGTFELLNYRKDGTPFWNRLNLTPLRDTTGTVTHYVGVQSDVSSQVQANLEVRQALELLEATNRQLTSANKRMKRNLEAAARIQQAMLPDKLPKTKACRFAWKYLPSEELAGDTLNIFQLDKEHVALYLLDVTGHGTAAALLAVAVSRILSPVTNSSSIVWENGDDEGELRIAPPDRVATELNYLFPWDSDTGQFFTLVYGILNTATGEFRFVTAGHPGPIRLGADGAIMQAGTTGLPIGLATDPYEEQVLHLAPGDRMVLYSDGIVEVMNPERQIFGRARMLEAVQQGCGESLDRCLDRLLQAAEAWRGSRRFQDDLSMVAVERVAS